MSLARRRTGRSTVDLVAGADGAPLRVRGLRIAYGADDREALRGIDLDVAPGEVVGVVGEGGSGKSSLVEAVVGLLGPSAHMGGTVEVFGLELASLPAAVTQQLRGTLVGTIVSGGRSRLNPMARVGDQIENVLLAHGATRRAARARTLELLDEVGIPDPQRRSRAYPHELSGGMAQRIVIAIAIAARPRLILADEPTRGLDVTIQAEVLELLGRLIVEYHACALLATRDLGIVAEHCSRVVVLRDGTVVESAPVAEFFQAPSASYSAELLAAEFDVLSAGAQAFQREAEASPA